MKNHTWTSPFTWKILLLEPHHPLPINDSFHYIGELIDQTQIASAWKLDFCIPPLPQCQRKWSWYPWRRWLLVRQNQCSYMQVRTATILPFSSTRQDPESPGMPKWPIATEPPRPWGNIRDAVFAPGYKDICCPIILCIPINPAAEMNMCLNPTCGDTHGAPNFAFLSIIGSMEAISEMVKLFPVEWFKAGGLISMYAAGTLFGANRIFRIHIKHRAVYPSKLLHFFPCAPLKPIGLFNFVESWIRTIQMTCTCTSTIHTYIGPTSKSRAQHYSPKIWVQKKKKKSEEVDFKNKF